MEKKLINKATGEVKLKKWKGQNFDTKENKELITWKESVEYKKVGDGPNDLKAVKKLVPAEVVNRADYINSFTGDVGLKNVLKKLVLAGKDPIEVANSGAFYSKQNGKTVDLSKLPDNIVDAYKAVEKGVKAFDSLPPELKKKASFDKFAKEVKDIDIENYVNSKFKEPKKVEETKKEEVK